MLPCRVLCLLAILFCCVSASGAADAGGVDNEIRIDPKSISDLAELAVESVKAANATRNKILQLKDECIAAAKNATDLTREAKEFVAKINKLVKEAETNPSDGEAEKKKGDELLEKVKKAAAVAENTARLTKEATKLPIFKYGETARELLVDFRYSYDEMNKSTTEQVDDTEKPKLKELHEKVESAFPYRNETALAEISLGALVAVEDAQEAAKKTEPTVEPAKEVAILLKEALKKLEEVITAANEIKEKITPEENKGSPNNTEDNSDPSDSTSTHQPSPVTVSNAEITSIAPSLQNKPIVDSSSVSPVWMRTAAPLLIVAVMFSVTVY
ncbi:uncharacterized protein TM35_000471240 [Trypanosoma theileri]|uniref:Uncharacterized protein n=1 Tax=Trypanosoma theileri TaxID=67003 RepID=A0A1X0NJ68_9TRYP|nr:uncharacterized protein TM35_000471240 [Trypanosoma theileri]ORC84229.1 hypothetical protein TM35_000471240 [Trypanosoma theileri]